MHKYSFLLIILASLLTACQTTSPINRRQSASLASIPVKPGWINNPPHDSNVFLYGLGEASTKKAAIQEALADLAAKLGVTVTSQFKTQLRVELRGYEYVERDSEKSIETEVKAVTINQYQIEQVYAPTPMQVYVLIKTDKRSLYTAYKRELENIIAEFKAAQSVFLHAGLYQRYQLARYEQQRSAVLHRKLLIAKTLHAGMDMTPFLAYEQQVIQQYKTAKAALSFRLSYDSVTSRAFAQPILTALAQVDLLKSRANSIQVKVSTSVRFSRANGFYIGRYQVHVDVYEGKKLIGGRQFALKGASLQSRSATASQAIKKLSQIITEKGYWYSLGLLEAS